MSYRNNDAFGFDGSWREYAPIAFSNLLLTIVTLGIYRFWATTRTRRYLWSRTRFIDDRLEWTGAGKELFIGFVVVAILLGAPFLVLQFWVQALAIRGETELAGMVSTAAFLTIFYLTGLARFRALRYRLSRTFWHGIRGGSDDQGYGYGLTFVWKSIAGYVSAGLLIPWSMVSLWNRRWNSMNFGSHRFGSSARVAPVFMRFLLFYLFPFLLIVGGGIALVAIGGVFAALENSAGLPPLWVILTFGGGIFGAYILFGLIALAYYAAFLREGIGNLRLERLEFGFEASTADWLRLFLGDVLLVVCTLGVGWIFLQYRHWKFFITYLEAYGEVDLDALTQSATHQPRYGEGLLDALDVGAF